MTPYSYNIRPLCPTHNRLGMVDLIPRAAHDIHRTTPPPGSLMGDNHHGDHQARQSDHDDHDHEVFVVYVAFVPLPALTAQNGHQLADRAVLVYLKTVQYENHHAQRVIRV